MPDISFDLLLPSGEVEKVGLARFKGEVVVVNFWATWCALRRREMPLFDVLQARYANVPLRVLAVALDRGSADKPRKFLADLKVEHLTQAHDPSYASARAVGLIGLPTTLVLDASGREIGRLAGEAEWNSPAVHALLTRNWKKLRPRISASALTRWYWRFAGIVVKAATGLASSHRLRHI